MCSRCVRPPLLLQLLGLGLGRLLPPAGESRSEWHWAKRRRPSAYESAISVEAPPPPLLPRAAPERPPALGLFARRPAGSDQSAAEPSDATSPSGASPAPPASSDDDNDATAAVDTAAATDDDDEAVASSLAATAARRRARIAAKRSC